MGGSEREEVAHGASGTKRLYLFLGGDLFERIARFAEQKGLTTSQLAVAILENADWEAVLSESEPLIIEQVKSKVAELIKDKPHGYEFTLTEIYKELKTPFAHRGRTGVMFREEVTKGLVPDVGLSPEKSRNGTVSYFKK